MANSFFERGRESFADGTVDWDTDTIKAGLYRLTTADVGIKAITGASNATPIVITATSHGFANGDIVSIGGVGGNLAANGVFKIANQAANTFELTNPITGANVTGSAAYTSGGYAVNLGLSASGDHFDDFDGALVGTEVTLAGKTATAGVLDANDVTFPTPPAGAAVQAVMIREDTGTASTSRMVLFIDGRQIVTVAADASASATTLWVERLAGAIPNGTVLTFTNGFSATLSSGASAGARSLAVSALSNAIAAGHRADAPSDPPSGVSGLPITPNGNDITNTWDNGENRIGKL
jgi:hypothetical protein